MKIFFTATKFFTGIGIVKTQTFSKFHQNLSTGIENINKFQASTDGTFQFFDMPYSKPHQVVKSSSFFTKFDLYSSVTPLDNVA